jgi:hypothetical protein
MRKIFRKNILWRKWPSFSNEILLNFSTQEKQNKILDLDFHTAISNKTSPNLFKATPYINIGKI